MTLITRSLNQLLDELANDEHGEADYRRGMSDGIGKVLLAVETVPAHIGKTQLEEKWRWWHQLLRWSRVPLSQASEPPNIEWHEPTEER